MRFLNRVAQLQLIGSHVDLLRNDSRHFVVFEVLGLGGVGKTRLLNELREKAHSGKQVPHVLWVSLEAEASATEIGPLRAIREQVNVDCPLFDTALLTYWNATGQPFQVGRSSSMARSLAFRSVEVGGAIAAIPLPLTFAVDLYRSLSRKATRMRRYSREDFEAIDALRFDPSAIRVRLPHYLGRDIELGLQSTEHSLVAFYDAYEKQAPSTLSAKAPWLREFIGTLDRGLHVISTREPLGWDEAAWGKLVQPVRLCGLPDPESREMLRARLGELPRQIEERLVNASRRIPFFLEAAIDAYAIRAGEGTVDVSDLPASPEAAVSYLLEHFTHEQRSVAIALASVQTFDAGSYRHMIRALHLPASVLDFDDFVAWFFVEELSPGLYKTHDLLTAFVRASSSDAETRLAALDAATLDLLARCRGDGLVAPATLLALFRSVIAGWNSLETMPSPAAETLIDAGYLLYDAGYWQELESMTMAPEETTRGEHPIIVIVEFFAALAARRTVGVDRALERFAHLEPRASALGRHEQSVELEVAYLSELAGNYARARQEFQQLNDMARRFDPANRTHFRSRLYHADMLIMDGEFEQGSRLLLEAYESLDHRAPLDWAELVRHRAHAFRFSFLLEQAEDLYLRAMRAATSAPALLGKLQTNLAEARCWHDPKRALDAAGLSTEINLRLGNQIELAKCDSARGIALGRLGEFTAARDVIAKAAQQAREVGYPAGVAFAMQAEAVVESLAGNAENSFSRAAGLSEAVASLGTYAHLRVAPAWLSDNDSVFVETAAGVDWLAADEFDDRLRTYLGPRRSHRRNET